MKDEDAAEARGLPIILPLVMHIDRSVDSDACSFLHNRRVARLDTRNMLVDAPQAKIQLNTSSSAAIMSDGSNECFTDYESCDFRVVHTGDRFIYLSPISADTSQESRRLYALPITAVKSIRYSLE